MWITHATLLQEILNGNPRQDHTPRPTETIYTILADNFADIQKRNDAMWFRNLPPRVLARLTEAVSDVTVRISSLPEVTPLMLLVRIEIEFYRTNDRPRELQFFRWRYRKRTTVRGEARPPPYLVCDASPVWGPSSVRCGHDPPPRTSAMGCAGGETEFRCT
jgi:hypothetical protein